ncbi:hypothetical protein MNBD_GAMMA09-2024 [hydrothermal vent metagenome]|uniref:ASPIC/UnbV domain-containing protein n=1 Tax=hydrothermal vent metagenome TaxID=652676 RepID=A0A3B0XPR4_9ZZZZ
MKIITAFADKRILFTTLLLLTLAFSFWSGSRVPALNEKATMGTEIDFNNLGFNTVFEVQPEDPLIKRVAYTTVNWVDTNKKGMTFGLLFASAIMTLFSLMTRRSFNNGFANSALGLVIGTPLGVCVNCAAPIAAGMAASGSKIETTLATMISSPTMNVIVLTILLSLFPFYLVAIKLSLTLLFILFVIPMMTRYFLKKEAETLDTMHCGIAANSSCPIPSVDTADEATRSNSFPALKWVVVNYLKNLWFVVRTTVPLMFLAGFLGSLMITILPWESIANIIPETNMFMTLLSMTLVALVGVFLPVPIAFDVIICAVLLATGMPVKYVMVLLFTLGVFSVYSFFVVSQSVSKRAAFIMFFILTGMGVSSGIIAHQYEKIDIQNKADFFIKFFLTADNVSEPVYRMKDVYKVKTDQALLPELKSNALTAEPLENISGLEISQIAFSRDDASLLDKNSATLFTEFSGDDFSMPIPGRFSLFKMELPFLQGHGRGVSTGDVHNDGRSDVLIRAEASLMLYANKDGKKFVRQAINVSELSDLSITNAALIDINNDGWSDIFLSSYVNGNYLILNDHGSFEQKNFIKLPNISESGMSLSAAFGDVDRDGDLDIVLGNWELGWGEGTWIATDKTRNVVLRNNGNNKFSVEPLPGHPGIPTSIMLSDFTNDGILDIVVGNDFGAPDYFYTGTGDGRFKMITIQDGIFTHSTYDTMSISSADINNDLLPEIYVAEIAYYDHNKEFTNMLPEDACMELKAGQQETCLENVKTQRLFSDIKQKKRPQDCSKLKDSTLSNECVMLFVARRPAANGGFATQETCGFLPKTWKAARSLCLSNLNKAVVVPENEKAELIPQTRGANVLFVSDGNGKYIDRAEEYGLNYGGWAWNSKFADLNNDEWQDLYIANGTLESQRRRESNYYFQNKQGKTFDNLTEESGLKSRRSTSSFSYVDLDNDGDIDVIAVPQVGAAQVFINNTNNSAHSIAFSLNDEQGNRSGIGSKLIIYYGENSERHQMREVQASSGFISFDDPTVYFGLNNYQNISRLEIVWSNGSKSEINRSLKSGHKYTISRKSSALAQVNAASDDATSETVAMSADTH